MRDVASYAGVSVATVSRVLNDSPRVDPATRARIEAAIDALHYVRHGGARSLTLRRFGCIGVIVPLLGTAVYAEAVEAIEERLQQNHCHLLTACCGYDPAKELDLARAFIEHGIDGLILVGNTHDEKLYDLVEQSGLPTVQTFGWYAESRLPSIGFDNFAPSVEIADYLIGLGHRRIAILHGRYAQNDRIAARYNGILHSLHMHRIALPPALSVEVGHTIPEGGVGLRRLLASNLPFSAVICTGDVLAMGVLIEARRCGLKVPEDLSVTGFHDHDLAAQFDPPLTTIHAPVREMGLDAADYLLAAIAGQTPAHVTQHPTSLVVRGSTAPPAMQRTARPRNTARRRAAPVAP